METPLSIYLVTCNKILDGGQDEGHLRRKLQERGHAIKVVSWTDSDVCWGDADAVVIRTPWDYHRDLPRFLSWAAEVESKTALLNPLSTVRWNSSKNYLSQLQEAGVHTIPTAITTELSIARAAAEKLFSAGDEVVLKPTVSAGAELTYRIKDLVEFDAKAPEIIDQSELIVQPFVASVASEGEASLLFVHDGERAIFTHALVKTAQSGDFRVQQTHGGTIESLVPSPELMQFAERALEFVTAQGFSFLYARVDIVDWKTSVPKIGEIEMIEPEFFFRLCPEAAGEFANALEKRVRIIQK